MTDTRSIRYDRESGNFYGFVSVPVEIVCTTIACEYMTASGTQRQDD